jgi:hypothetical protein
MSDTESGLRPKVPSTLSTDKVLQTVGGILLSIVSVTTAWSLKEIVAYGTRIAVLETKREADDKGTAELKGEITKQLAELSRQLERLNDKLERKP